MSKSSWPVREQQTLHGLPIWHSAPCPSTHSVNEKTPSDYTEFGAAIITGLTSVICIYRGLVAYLRRGGDPETTIKFGTLFLFDTIVTVYVTVTFAALVAGLIFSVGKLWAIFGIFHNVLEVFIIAALCYKKTTKYIAFTCIYISVYSVVVTGIIGRLPWYWDSMFFKFQGLILDFILPVLFFVVPREGSSGETQPLLNHKKTIPLPHVMCLVAASIVHLIGNVSDIIGGESASSSIIFNLSYFVAFPIYAIYAFGKSGDKREDDFQSININIYDFILLVLWGVSASAIATLIGINALRCA